MIFGVEIPIFLMHVIFIGDCSAEEAAELAYNYEDGHAHVGFSQCGDGGVRVDKGDIYCWVKDTSKASFVFHELVHVAFSICEEKGIIADEELIAYLMGWLKINVSDKVFGEVTDGL